MIKVANTVAKSSVHGGRGGVGLGPVPLQQSIPHHTQNVPKKNIFATHKPNINHTCITCDPHHTCAHQINNTYITCDSPKPFQPSTMIGKSIHPIHIFCNNNKLHITNLVALNFKKSYWKRCFVGHHESIQEFVQPTTYLHNIQTYNN
jgi:hypothetical protein